MNGQVAGIIGNTFLAGAAGMVTALIVGWLVLRHAEVNLAIKGALAGLVAITAGCHAVTAPSAVVVGAIGSIVMMCTEWILERCQVDDAIGAMPVHGAAGVWGTIAIAFFGIPEILGTGLSRWAQFQIQLTGVLVALTVTLGNDVSIIAIGSRDFSTACDTRRGTAWFEYH